MHSSYFICSAFMHRVTRWLNIPSMEHHTRSVRTSTHPPAQHINTLTKLLIPHTYLPCSPPVSSPGSEDHEDPSIARRPRSSEGSCGLQLICMHRDNIFLAHFGPRAEWVFFFNFLFRCSPNPSLNVAINIRIYSDALSERGGWTRLWRSSLWCNFITK